MQKILNYINGKWLELEVNESMDVINPPIGF
jgi:hypothetical protein